MAGEDIAIDTQLLVLLVTGLTSREYIRMNKRLRDYTQSDFETLFLRISRAERLVVTAGVLAETSNFVRNINEPARTAVMQKFGLFIAQAHEIHIPAKQATTASAFIRLGFTDAAIVELEDVTVLTADGPLYSEALRRGRTAENFNHLREANQ